MTAKTPESVDKESGPQEGVLKDKPQNFHTPQHVWNTPARRPRVWKGLTLIFVFLLLLLHAKRNLLPPDLWMLEETLSIMEPGKLTAARKARLHEVADLLLEIYKTLADMRYLDPAGIQEGPHDIEHLRPMYEEHRLDPAVVYLYSILPYINTEEAGNIDFFQGSSFADFRQADVVENGRDPFYGSPEGDDFEDENGPYMRPWVTPLSELGNHQSIIIYDTRRHRIWLVDQEGWSSTDRALEDVKEKTPKTANRNSFEHIPSRSAGDVLRDINRWFRTFEELPGGEHSDQDWWDEEMDLPTLYQQHGWPDRFDGDAFEVAKARKRYVLRAKYDAEEPVRSLETYKSRLRWANNQNEVRRKALAEAESKNDEWLARLDLWESSYLMHWFSDEHREAAQEVERLCPNGICQKQEDLPLWELAAIEQENNAQQERIESDKELLELSKDDNNQGQELTADLRHALREASICEKALLGAKADAERLCPGRSVEEIIGTRAQNMEREIQKLKKEIFRHEDVIANLQEWEIKIPEDAKTAREKVSFLKGAQQKLVREWKEELEKIW